MSFTPMAPFPRDPRTPREWQEAADLAWTLLMVDSAKQYGLITGGPAVNLDRCETILHRASRRGIKPHFNEEIIRELCA